MNIQEEIIEINKMLAYLQAKLGDLTNRIETEGFEKLRQLEADNERLRDGVKQLRTAKAELQRQATVYGPELEKAVEARDGAIRKLRHARRVIKDLVEEREKAEARSRTVSPVPSAVSMGSLEDIMSSRSSASSGNSSSDSGKTIRGKDNRSRKVNPEKMVSPTLPATNGFFIAKQESRRADLSAHPTPRTTDGDRSRTLSPAPSISVTPSSPTSSLRSESDRILVHFVQPPRSAILHQGPYTWQDLRRIFDLDNDTIAALRKLKSDQQLQMRVLFLTNVAFIYDPIFGETGNDDKSLLLDWGDKESNERIINYVTEDGSIFHTFVFPTNKERWYYLGALTWQPADSKKWAVWPRLSRKAELLRKLKGRSGADERVEERMASGEAEQITFEISGHDQQSQEFATTILSA